MDHLSSYEEATTPALRCKAETVNQWSTEDSGYQTSFTPSSIVCNEISSENVDPATVAVRCNKYNLRKIPSTPNKTVSNNLPPRRKNARSKNVVETPVTPDEFSFRNSTIESGNSSPSKRRAKKRALQADFDDGDWSFKSASTPTSIIAGGIKNLVVNDSENVSSRGNNGFLFKDNLSASEYSCLSNLGFEEEKVLSYPTTPEKDTKCKIMKLSHTSDVNYNCHHHHSPLRVINNNGHAPRKTPKKLNFVPDLLTPEDVNHQSSNKSCKASRTVLKPEKKVDFIRELSETECYLPAIKTILGYLGDQDTYNFSKVSPLWHEVCKFDRQANIKRERYIKYIVNTKENHQNRESFKKMELAITVPTKLPKNSLRDIHNIVSARQSVKSPKRSPPGTPRTIKFQRFIKSASLDSRTQLLCIRCSHPAKVTREESGQEWVACGSGSCAFKYCRFCNQEWHHGNNCILYDLNARSPRKRLIKTTTIGSKNSKKNLKRLY